MCLKTSSSLGGERREIVYSMYIITYFYNMLRTFANENVSTHMQITTHP